jgi:pyridoxamine 5'-phosphate oxidase
LRLFAYIFVVYENENDMMDGGISKLRKEYQRDQLDEQIVGNDPLLFFRKWLDEAVKSEIPEPNAMVLSTVSQEDKPSSRTVLLKGLDEEGLWFFTNYESRKGHEIARNHHVSILFLWLELERQVRIEGKAEKLTGAPADEYFGSRPAVSQVSAIISPQSKVVPDREYLEKLRNEYLRNNPVDHKRPAYWGGYRIAPENVEFWQGRPGRLHDRILFVREKDGWKKMRLAP